MDFNLFRVVFGEFVPRHRLSTLSVLFLVFAFAQPVFADTFTSSTSSDVAEVRHVLLINSYDQSYRWTLQMTDAVKRKLDESGIPYNLEVENMDTKRVNDATSTQLLYEQFKYKFSKLHYDIVLTTDDDALNLVLKHRNDFFPGTPVVFCGTKYLQNRLDILKGQTLITGVNEDINIKQSVDIALALQPETRHLYFIHDNSTTGLIVGEYIQKLIPQYQTRYDVTVLDGSMTEDEILSKIKQLPPKSLIYLTVFNYDRDYKYLDYSELLKEIRKLTDAPIYGTWDFHLGDGIVGGMLTSGSAQAGAMADIAVRVLKGEDINQIPITMKSPNVYAFDYEQLIEKKSLMANIPKGSSIINQPENFYTQYKTYVRLGIAIFVLLILVMIMLVIRDRFTTLKLSQVEVLRDQLEKAVSEKTAELEFSNVTLRKEVEQRNKSDEELRRTNQELKKFNSMVVDRELKMIELKKEIRSLEVKNGGV